MIFICFRKAVTIAGMLVGFGLCTASAQSTQVLISPTGDGGFENGISFAANGWTVENYASDNFNKWIVGDNTSSAGARSAYISENNNTNTYVHTGLGVRSRVMFWRDIVFPAGYTTITLSFKIRVQGEVDQDDLTVFFQSGNTVPSVSQPNQSLAANPNIFNATRLATISMQGAQYVTKTYTLNAGNATASTTRRLIFYWENGPNLGTQPPASIDEISLTAVSSCTPPAITSFTNGYNCGPGSVTLNAATVSGATIQWYASATGGVPLATGNTFTTPVLASTANYYISARQGNCITSSPRQMVTAEIKSFPAVDLGSDIEQCTAQNDSVLLDAGILPDNPTFLWNNGRTGPSIYVHQPGTYIVKATDQYGCEGADTIVIDFKPKPIVDLGNDIDVCIGNSALLDAGNTNSVYLWNTGSTAQQITVQSPGNYYVKVTGTNGCYQTDTVAVTMNGQLPAVDGIIVRNDGIRNFNFIADNPRNAIAYYWDFGDGTPGSNEEFPEHTYNSVGIYTVTLTLYSTCDSVKQQQIANIVGIAQLDIAGEDLLITPNPSRGNVMIINKSRFKMQRIELCDIVGKAIYGKVADSSTGHRFDMKYLPAGIYLIKIITDKGTVTRKLQLI